MLTAESARAPGATAGHREERRDSHQRGLPVPSVPAAARGLPGSRPPAGHGPGPGAGRVHRSVAHPVELARCPLGIRRAPAAAPPRPAGGKGHGRPDRLSSRIRADRDHPCGCGVLRDSKPDESGRNQPRI